MSFSPSRPQSVKLPRTKKKSQRAPGAAKVGQHPNTQSAGPPYHAVKMDAPAQNKWGGRASPYDPTQSKASSIRRTVEYDPVTGGPRQSQLDNFASPVQQNPFAPPAWPQQQWTQPTMQPYAQPIPSIEGQYGGFNGQVPMMDPSFFQPPPGMPWQGFDGGQPPPFPFNTPFLSHPNMRAMSTTAAQSQGPASMPGPARRTRSATPQVKVPAPTLQYLNQSSLKPEEVPSKRPLLVILDLNGTLIFRKLRKFPPKFSRRAGLDHFLAALIQNYKVMVWSSSQPPTVNAVCEQLFPGVMHDALVARWGRDKFGLTARQYNNRIQVYKELHKPWADPVIQAAFPGNEYLLGPAATAEPSTAEKRASRSRQEQAAKLPAGHRWDQTNTILIDDSKLKALSEPFNILEIPEFNDDPTIDESKLFAKVLHYLDICSRHDDVSKVLRTWTESAEKNGCSILDLGLGFDETSIDTEEGGISLFPEQLNQRNTVTATPVHPVQNQPQGQAPGPGQGKKKGKKAKSNPPPPLTEEEKAARQAAKKERKKAKKSAAKAEKAAAAATKAAAAESRAQAETNPALTELGILVNGELDSPNGSNNQTWAPAPTGSKKRSKKQKARDAANAKAEQDREDQSGTGNSEPEPAPRYNLRTNRAPIENGCADDYVPETAVAETEAREEMQGLEPQLRSRAQSRDMDAEVERSPSPVSVASENSLLDRLEEGLGIKQKR
ncbi:hypothetical protein MYU51_010283 [Penicillium brevicompactum]